MAESLRQHGVAFHPPNLVAQELSSKTLLQETSPSSFSSKKNLETASNKKRNQIKEIRSEKQHKPQALPTLSLL